VRIAATGGRRITAWLQAIDREVSAGLVWPEAAGGGVRLSGIDFIARPASGGAEVLLGRVELDSTLPSADQRRAVQGELPARGAWDLLARLHALKPAADSAGPTLVELESPPLRIQVRDVLLAEQLEYAAQGSANLLRGVEVEIEASSEVVGQTAALAVDGRQGTAWQFEATDTEPRLRIELRRAVKASRLALSHALPNLESGARARVTRLAIVLDGKRRFETEMPPDPLRKCLLDLGGVQRIKAIDIEILGVGEAEPGALSTGLAEVELLP
jgi:hypothetical protein